MPDITATKARKRRVVAKSFKPKEAFGEPKAVLMNAELFPRDDKGLPKDGNYAKLGVLLGRATAIGKSERTDERTGAKTYWTCLVGAFRAVPENDKLETINASKAWVPEHIERDIANQLRDNDPINGTINERGAEAIEFVYEVGIKSDRSIAAGFEWMWSPLVDQDVADETDPLAELTKRFQSMQALPAPAKDKSEDAAEAEAAEDAAVRAAHAKEAAIEAAKDKKEAFLDEKNHGRGSRHKA